MTLARRLLRVYHYAAHLLTWTVVVFIGVSLNLGCAVLLLARDRDRHGAALRTTIRWLFSSGCAWLRVARLVYIRFHGFTPEAVAGPAVYVANHPGMLDAPFILARLPDAICIFKPAFMRNPVLGAAALVAGYAAGTSGVDLIRDVAARVSAGRSLLIFPEGTRTLAGATLNPLKPGFALIAARARVPVRVIVVRAPRDLAPKGWPWWRAPEFPSHVDITLVREITLRERETAAELTARVGLEFSSALAPS
ncbi:MAG: lysophospholipid acyltransferase family protein [Opitutaceae bacterium]